MQTRPRSRRCRAAAGRALGIRARSARARWGPRAASSSVASTARRCVACFSSAPLPSPSRSPSPSLSLSLSLFFPLPLALALYPLLLLAFSLALFPPSLLP
eukprot:1600838-Pleurochrysis_carterae.AAC.1